MIKDANNYEFEVNLSDINHASTKGIELIGFDKKVLELGCATGFISKVLKDRRCKVTGIEIDGNAATKAKVYCERVIVGDIENLDFNESLHLEKFDVIYFGDILEHLKDPKRILLGIRNFLEKDGYLVISVPNIAHWSSRLELFLGDFDYQNLGILDDSHLKFFTKKAIIELLEACGYIIDAIDSVKQFDSNKVESILRIKGFNDNESKKISLMLKETNAEAFQYVIKAYACSENKYLEKISREKISLENEIKEKNILISEKDIQITELDNRLHAHIHNQETLILDKDNHIHNQETLILDKDNHIRNLETLILNKDNHIRNLETQIIETNKKLNDIYSSAIWKITFPFRYLSTKLKSKKSDI